MRHVDIVGGMFCGFKVSVDNMIEGCLIAIPCNAISHKTGFTELDDHHTLHVKKDDKAHYVGLYKTKDYEEKRAAQEKSNEKDKDNDQKANEKKNKAKKSIERPKKGKGKKAL